MEAAECFSLTESEVEDTIKHILTELRELRERDQLIERELNSELLKSFERSIEARKETQLEIEKLFHRLEAKIDKKLDSLGEWTQSHEEKDNERFDETNTQFGKVFRYIWMAVGGLGVVVFIAGLAVRFWPWK
jgi:predicted  nucleic acid-binding Zn-ribbon protein